MEQKTFIEYLDHFFPIRNVIDYCPNGLQIEGNKSIKKIATAVSANLDTIHKAIQNDVDALIVHHGLFWFKDSYVIAGPKKDKISLLLNHGISLFCYHLPLDMHNEVGNNWKAALDLGWENLEPFGELNGLYIGVKGIIPAYSQNELKNKLENYYGHPAAVALGGPTNIKTIALISGGAHKNISEAAKEKIDAFITGSFDEPVWSQAFEEKINFYALGHSATEKVGPKALAEHLAHELSLETIFIDSYNPF